MPKAAPEHLRHWPEDPLRPQNPLVSQNWIVAGVLTVVLGALVLAYACLLFLYWQGQWQLLFHPSHIVNAIPANAGLAFQDVRFDTTETGQPLLNGWWIPATGREANGPTALYLHGADGSLANTVPDLAALHAAGLNVFAFDYRGYGQSAWARPSEQRWRQDAAAAWTYLADTRHLAPDAILLCGRGYGASVAADLAAAHPHTRALVLINPRPPAMQALEADSRSRYVPVRLLAHDRFNPAPILQTLPTPKLFLAPSPGIPYAASAAPPKAIVRSAPGPSPLADTRAQAALRQLITSAPSR
jgi:pimeloyl-ACP methyl ester carboxylesterase